MEVTTYTRIWRDDNPVAIQIDYKIKHTPELEKCLNELKILIKTYEPDNIPDKAFISFARIKNLKFKAV